MLGRLYNYLEKNKTGSISHTVYQDKYENDQRFNRKIQSTWKKDKRILL